MNKIEKIILNFEYLTRNEHYIDLSNSEKERLYEINYLLKIIVQLKEKYNIKEDYIDYDSVNDIVENLIKE